MDNFAHGQEEKERRKARGMVIKVIEELACREAEIKKEDKDLEVEDDYNNM